MVIRLLQQSTTMGKCPCLSVACLLILVSPHLSRPCASQILTSELTGEQAPESAEEVANRTYVEEQSALQRRILLNYNRKIRPVRNQSTPITVSIHTYLMHLSVDQAQQTITLNGHIYMTWFDEMAVWDPVEFNDVRSTIVKQWELWTPDLKIANSVTGAGSYSDISRRSHATLTSLDPNTTKVEAYPSFSVKLGCNFDYSEYPFDVQSCAMQLYTMSVMSEVELEFYYQMNPSLILGWGDQSEKNHISDWELTDVTSNITYYKQGKYLYTRPPEGYAAMWTVMLVIIKLQRNAGPFWMLLAVSALVCNAVVVLSPLMPNTRQAVMLILTALIFDVLFQRDLMHILPPVITDPPRIARCGTTMILLTMAALFLHLFFHQTTLLFSLTRQRLRHGLYPVVLRRLPTGGTRQKLAEEDEESGNKEEMEADRKDGSEENDNAHSNATKASPAEEVFSARIYSALLLGLANLLLALIIFLC